MIKLVNISFTYEDKTLALNNIDFKVDRGEFNCLLASNGGGKSTLLKIIIGLLSPQRGSITIDNNPIEKYKPKDLYQKMSLVFQNPADQLFCAKVYDDIAFGPTNLGLSEKEIKLRVDEALSAVEMEKYADKAIHHLSFGQQKRVCIAGVLAMGSEIIILDEPTAGLDPSGEIKILKLLKNLNKNGKTVVMATHLVDLIPLFADNIYVLNNGTIGKKGTAKEVFLDSEFLEQVNLRIPYVTQLLNQLKNKDGLPLEDLSLTVGQARKNLLQMVDRVVSQGTLSI